MSSISGVRFGVGLGLSGLLALLGACGGGSDQAADSTLSRSDGRDVRPSMLAGQASAPLAALSAGTWSPIMPMPLVPSSAAQLPNGKILLWASNTKFSFGGGGVTYTAEFDPVSGAVSERRVDETGHDMFCTGTANLADGSLLVNGGDNSEKTSIFNALTGKWTTAATMNIPRGYEANTVLPNGSVLTLGGSWSGGQGNKHAEVWSAASGWRRLPGAPVDAALAPDAAGVYRSDNHMWLLTAPNGKVLHAGPSAAMNWISTQGDGSITPAGPRGDDQYAQSGNVAMYDIGKVLKVGGGPAYDSPDASTASYVIDINAGVSVRKVAPMAYPRIFGNAVVLPNGQVMVIGGQTHGKGFSDDFSVLPAELWDPVTERFTTLPPIAVGRNYHSVALLLPDARVMSGGGGLCGEGCAANHPDIQIYTPHYLLNADGSPAARPVIQAAPAQATHGTTIPVATDGAVSAFALVRLSSTTHTVNNDQRRVPLQFTARSDTQYDLVLPSNPGVVLPGYYMLFALNDRGVPSVAKMIQVTGAGAPELAPLDSQISSVGTTVRVPVAASSASAVRFSAIGLPAGLSIQPDTGVITGAPTVAGQYAVSIAATNTVGTTSTRVVWTVQAGSTQEVSYVRLQALSEVNGNPWASMAEFNLLDASGEVMSRAGWRASASSEETQAPGQVAYALDGDPATGWHTQYIGGTPVHPHSFVVNLGAPRVVTGFKYLPRTDSPNGIVALWRFEGSRDGTNWTTLAQGNFKDFGAITGEKVIYFNNVAQGKAATQSSTAFGGDASRAVDGQTLGDYAAGASVSHTDLAPNNWWQVDLGSVQSLSAIRLWNRTDCCANRLSNFEVLVSATDMTGKSLASLLADPAVWHVRVAGEAGVQTTLRARTSGRFVRVQLAGTDYLSLAEVQVFATAGNRAPVFVPLDAQTHVVGRSLALNLSAIDADGDAMTYAATGLPPGLSMNPVSGVINGRPTTTGRFNVNLQATDTRGAVGSLSLLWTVVAAPVDFVPTASPPVLVGGGATFNVGTSGQAGASYQWNFGDGVTLTSESPTISHTYGAPGLYNVQLAVISGGQVVATRSFTQAVYSPPTGTRPTNSSTLAWETRAGASARVWMVNPDNGSVSVFNAVNPLKVAEIPTGLRPHSVAMAPDGRVWVANTGSSSVSVIDPASLKVVQTVSLPRASQPRGVAFAPNGAAAYVALAASGRVLKLHPVTGQTLASASVGEHPRELSISSDSARVLVSRFITPALPGEATGVVQTRVNGAPRGGEVLALNAATLAVERTIVLQHSEKADSTVQGRGVPNYLGAAVVSPDGRSAWVPSKQDNVMRGVLRDGQNLNFQNTVRAISSRIDLGTWAEDLPARVDHDNAGQAAAAVFHPTGAYLFVALPTSRQIAVLDAARHTELMRVDAGRAPQGLVLSADGLRLYVDNFMDRTLGVYDLSRLVNFGELNVPRLVATRSVDVDQLSPTVLLGKQLFYDARDTRLARDGYLSCATCHNDGGHDGRTWDLTGFGEGLRNTISLRGRGVGHGALHWSGNFDEVQDFEGQIRSLAAGTGLLTDAQFNAGTRSQPLGERKAGLSADLDALAAYVASLDTMDPSPYRAEDGSLTPAARAGQQVFAAQCSSCHAGVQFTDSALNSQRNVGTLKPSSGKRLGAALTGLDTPTLRDVWDSAPYLHDGSAPTIEDAVRAHRSLSLSAADLASVSAYVRQIGREEPSAPGPSALGTGLSGAYFSNASLQGQPVRVREEAIYFNWGLGAPAADVPADGFSVRWSGLIEAPASGVHVLRTLSDDGVRVWIDGKRLIDNWTVHAPATDTTVPLNWAVGQRHAITLEYQELGGPGTMQLLWQTPGSSGFVPVPVDRLYPSRPTLAVNLARGKPATQSSLGWGGVAARAVDGDTNGVYDQGSVTHTDLAANNWWQVDLGALHELQSIRLWNRTDCCAERLANAYVLVSSSDMTGRSFQALMADPAVSRTWISGLTGPSISVPLTPAAGRYVRVQLVGTDYLSLAEVEVFGVPAVSAASKINLARGKQATQSSLSWAGAPERAIDGNLNGIYWDNSVTHTAGVANDWWQVDLGTTRNIDMVRLWNRTDCCTERLSNAVVFVSNNDMTGRSFATLSNDAAVWRYPLSGGVVGQVSVPVFAPGRFVRVQLAGTNYLSLAEVEVWGN